MNQTQAATMSLATRGRGLKRHKVSLSLIPLVVARHTRAWIETLYKIRFIRVTGVARHTRAWIETFLNGSSALSGTQSLATRGRGLKLSLLSLSLYGTCRSPHAGVD